MELALRGTEKGARQNISFTTTILIIIIIIIIKMRITEYTVCSASQDSKQRVL
jgi:hypothetical protein